MIPRLYVDAPLKTGGAVPLSEGQAHYLRAVLRREVGAELRLFNGRDGEFTASLEAIKKKSGIASVGERTREQTDEPGLRLLFAPVKRGPVETIVQKVTEIGVTRLTPVVTERTVATKLNIGRLQAIAIEAAEQCGRVSIPSVDETIKLSALLDGWEEDTPLIYCDEAGDDADAEWGGPKGRALPALGAFKRLGVEARATILIGPEGGFTPDERARLRSLDFVTPITLGPRILRADTAAISALVLWQAALGDWRRS